MRSTLGHIGLVVSLTLALTVLGTPGWLDHAPTDAPTDADLASFEEPSSTPSPTSEPEPSPTSAPEPSPTGSPASSPANSPASSPGPEPRTATVVLSGDLLWHDTVWLSAAVDADTHPGGAGKGQEFDFDPMFAALKPIIEQADLAVCHEEVPFAPPGGPYESYPVFAAPPEIAPWIASMGWDLCTTSSNHAVDQGFEGLVRTADLLEQAGVGHVGTFRTAAERRQPVIFTTDQGVRIAVVGGTFSLNGFPMPEGRPWAVSMWNARNLIAQARAARRAGADIVIVKYHGGSEYVAMPNAEQVALAQKLTASPYVDLVVGEHAHVVQPITKVNGKWVVYGMGNAIAQSESERSRAYEGITVSFTFREADPLADRGFVVDHAEYVPTYWNHFVPSGRPIRIQRVVRALATGRGDQSRLLEALLETRAAVDLLGHAKGLEER
ncbi:CapA family protein [Nocardioides agariphilus]|jgi:poly-gamma-glutamate synthesis protein (capsule biosynthesis protein)|uniref:CapA family protein n=1 Tax=Nocardioides agariphilus TaxID=433664 RepID=A0A930VTB2_9ACTN|nr:CapA family protein [Nocardioides agariphilus]MBF4769510.1 CapA family protein [Nocardioides agariphilus]